MSIYVYTMDIEQSLGTLGSNAATGLTEAEAAYRLELSAHGEPSAAKKRPFVLRILDQFKDPLVLFLIATAIVSAIIGGGVRDTFAIVAILTASTAIGIAQRNKANKAIRELEDASSSKARVKREGNIISVDTSDVVVGDIVFLSKGDRIPANIRIIDSINLRVDESSITGETAWAKKEANVVLNEDTPFGEICNLAYKGSIVTYGRGTGVVYSTGAKKASVIDGGADAEPYDTRTPLQDNLYAVAKSLSILCIIICALVFVTGMLYDFFDIGNERGILQLLVMSLSLAVAAAPKDIGTHAAVIMALSVQNMARSRIIVKNLRTALAIGCVDDICINKTGIFTQNKMTVTRVADSENVYEVTGVGYKAKGQVIAEIMITRNIALMSEIVVLCNDAAYDKQSEQITGDPTEGALLVFGAKLGHDKQKLDAARPRVQEIPFDSSRKMMSTYNFDGDRIIMYTKGAAEEIISRSTYVYLDGEIAYMSDAVREKLMERNDEFASQALRVLACAYKVYESESDIDNLEYDLIYVGMMGLADSLREDAAVSFKKCQSAGIGVKMITGDHKNTTRAVAQAYGIIGDGDEILCGNDIDAMPDEQLRIKAKTVNAFARVLPVHKLQIVTAMQAEEGNTVAMAGDGLDDAPAVRRADISIGMGTTCSGAVKDAADVIVGGNYFTSIVDAIERGKTLCANIRRAVSYILTCNTGMLMLAFFLIACGLPMPLKATQIMFIYLLTGTLPALALGMERKESGLPVGRMRNPEEYVLNRRVLSTSITRAVFLFIGSMAAFLYGLYVAIAPKGADQQILATSMCFFTTAAGQLLAAYPSKTDFYMFRGRALFNNRFLNILILISLLMLIAVMYTPGLNTLFAVIPLAADQVLICIILMLLIVLSFEISKPYART